MNLFIPGIPKSTQTGSIIRTKDGRAFPGRLNSAWSSYTKSYMAVNRPEKLMEGPITAHVVFGIPDVQNKKQIYPWKRPDLDNLLKKFLDGGNGILWHDDAQIVNLHVEKRYARMTEQRVPGVWLTWWEYKEV